MRIVSLAPSATEIVFALGLGDELVGVTHECDFPAPARDVPAVTRAVLDPGRASSHALHRLEEGSVQAGWSIRALDEAGLADARPELILAQRLCRECELGAAGVSEVAGRIGDGITVLSLDPTSVEGILNSISTVGAMTETEDTALEVVEGLRERLRAVQEIVLGRRDHGFMPPRVAAVEWLDPPFAAGRWVPDQVRLAGGWELLGREGGPAAATSWGALREVDPEVIVLMPAAHDLGATLRAWEGSPRPDEWDSLRAVREGRVHAVDAAPFSRPGPRVLDGIEVLAELIDPLAFDGISPPDGWARVP